MSPLLLLLAVACTDHRFDETDTDTADTADTGDSADTDPGHCVPNHDGTIVFDELVADPANHVVATYTTNTPGTVVPVDVDGTDNDDGTFTWDFSATDGPDTQTWDVDIAPLAGAWFASSFPTATYSTGLDASEELLGIYRVDPTQERLLLLGLASATPNDALLVYAQPIVVFEFPLVPDKTWSTTDVQADGTWEGTTYPANYGVGGTVTLHHTYTFTVDRRGTLHAPIGTFPALRLRLDQEMRAVNSLYGQIATTQTTNHFFVTECTGLVARIRSQDNVTTPSFTQATEYLRLGY